MIRGRDIEYRCHLARSSKRSRGISSGETEGQDRLKVMTVGASERLAKIHERKKEDGLPAFHPGDVIVP